MKLLVFAVYDDAVKSFMTPIFQQTQGQAIRGFIDAVNSPDAKNSLSKHPEDYTLMQLGSYDDQTGVLESLPTPENLGTALKYRVKQPLAAAV